MRVSLGEWQSAVCGLTSSNDACSQKISKCATICSHVGNHSPWCVFCCFLYAFPWCRWISPKLKITSSSPMQSTPKICVSLPIFPLKILWCVICSSIERNKFFSFNAYVISPLTMVWLAMENARYSALGNPPNGCMLLIVVSYGKFSR